MSPIETLEMVRLEAQNEAKQFRAQDEKWERVKLVAEIASRLYNHRAPVVMDALIYEAIAIVEAAEKALK
jgi:hypothetical protein